MEKRSSVWNFMEVNTERNLSTFQRIVIIGFAIAFILVPLAEISPDVFSYEGYEPYRRYAWDCLRINL